MHDVTSIVRGAFQGLLQDVADQYRHMQSMAPTDRDVYVQRLRSQAVEISSRIKGAETKEAVAILLRFQYAFRIIYRKDERGKSHYDDSFRWEKWEEGKAISSWRWSPPTETDFTNVMLSWAGKVDFYSLVNELCSDTSGLTIPGESETFEAYRFRAGVEEASWCWIYDDALKAEKGRWFTSKKRLAEIEGRRKRHRARASSCSELLAVFYPRVRPSIVLLESLKRLQLENAVSLNAAEDALNALRENVQLKHLLLEQRHELSGTYSQVMRDV